MAAAFLLGAGAARAGIDGESNTDGLNPAAELYDIAEARRLEQVGRHLELNRFMTWNAYYGPGSLWGPPLGASPVRQPIGYESKQVSPDRWIYRPVYGQEATPPEVIAAPPAASTVNPPAAPPSDPKLPAPSDARPGDFQPLPAAPKRLLPAGPREF